MSRAEETHLCRYSVVIVHNISMLRSQALLTCPGHISTICEAYRQLGPGTSLHRALDGAADVDGTGNKQPKSDVFSDLGKKLPLFLAAPLCLCK